MIMKRLLLLWFAAHCFLSSFTQNIGTFNTYLAIAASSSGKIIAVGQSSEGYMITSIPSYSPGWSEVSAVAWQGEKFIVVGSRVMRFNQNGTIDASFASGGAVPRLSGTDIEVLCSGKVLVATGNGIVRLMPDGTSDPSFGENGLAASSFSVIDIAIAPDGKIYALGKQNISRFMPDGTSDPSFMQAPLPVSEIEFSKVAIQADGKPVVVGSYNPFSPNSDIALLRLTLIGALDPSFSGDGWLTLDMAQRYDIGVDVSLQSDGKIIVLGTGILFQCPCPAVSNNGYILARYNSDGTLDTGFGVPTTLPIYNINPPFSLSFPGMGKTVMGSFLKATALELYGDSIYVAGGTTPASKGQGTSVFLNASYNDGSPLNFTSNLAATIPLAYSLPQGVTANTVYNGYAPASTLTLTVQLPEGSYAYEWNTGATASSISVSPTTTSTYSVTVTNAYGCMGTVSTIVQVVDVRCGNGNDKVQVCQAAGSSDKTQSICIAPSAVAAHLKKGSYLGSCTTVASSVMMKDGKKVPEIYSIKVFNNPTTNYFTLDIQSPNLVDKVTISIYDAAGSIRESRILIPNSHFDLGQLYPKGVYFAEVVQGSNKRILRLVKLQ
jgi:uncharacterized delta-60 repeat protein